MGIVTPDAGSVRTGIRHGENPDSQNWQWHVKNAIRHPEALFDRLGLPNLPSDHATGREIAHRQFATFVPWPYLSRIRPGDLNDPLLLQVLPAEKENQTTPGFVADAVGDLPATRARGLIHKYHGRALLAVSGACAVHCRYCFRRHYPYDTVPHSIEDLRPALDIVKEDPTIREVILSGGDPLMLVDARLQEVLNQVRQIEHVRRIRIHTRLPIVIPQRVTSPLLDALRASSPAMIMVLHVNHPNELDQATCAAIRELAATGIMLLNQAVLLRGVNDDEQTLMELSERLLDVRCLPYYLHQLDRVEGTSHFEVPVNRGLEIVRYLREHLPGYAVPRYVTEIPGEACKRELVSPD
jgi:EF-P beta-lysylation protein EpmB